MAHAPGTWLGGIVTLADLRSRCDIDADTGCWRWRGAAQLRAGYMGSTRREPRIRIHGTNLTTSIPRVAWMLAGKMAPGGIWTAWRVCDCDLCCNPEHLSAGSKADWGRWIAATGRWAGKPDRQARARRAGRSRSAVTRELAQWIQDSSQTGVELAAVLGISAATISRVRRGQRWSDTVAAASVFSFAAAVGRQPRRGASVGVAT